MSSLDVETKRKLREMGATPLLEAIQTQDEALVLGLGFEERIRIIVEGTLSLHPLQSRWPDPQSRTALPHRGPATSRSRR